MAVINVPSRIFLEFEEVSSRTAWFGRRPRIAGLALMFCLSQSRVCGFPSTYRMGYHPKRAMELCFGDGIHPEATAF
jgi:hypothetical protein